MNSLLKKILGGATIIAIGGASIFGGFSLISITLPPDTSTSSHTIVDDTNQHDISDNVNETKDYSKEPGTDPANTNKTNYMQVNGNSISGNLTFDNEKHEYKYNASNPGKYRFDFDINDVNCRYKITIYSSKNEKLSSGYSNNGGITVTLDKEKTYIIRIEQYSGYCSYNISIGVPLSEQNVVGTLFEGNILYKDQQDTYWFSSTYFGNYRFDFDIDDSNEKYKITIYDTKNNRINYAYSSNGGMTAELQENSRYKLIIEQYTGNPYYKITIGIPKQDIYLTSNSIHGSITYTDQEDCYIFVPYWSGKSVFKVDINDVNSKYKIEIYDSKNSKIGYGYSNNGHIAATLTQGETYKICVKQYTALCNYDINIYPE